MVCRTEMHCLLSALTVLNFAILVDFASNEILFMHGELLRSGRKAGNSDFHAHQVDA